MADRSKIEWTDASWNPIRARNRTTGKVGWHCEHLSPGCANCYAEGFNARLGTGLPFKPGHRPDVEIVLDETMLQQPLRWRAPRMIFVCSMTDLFADFVTDAMLDQVFAVMAASPQHAFQVLTKRSSRARRYLSDPDLPRRIARAWCSVGRHLQVGHVGWSTRCWDPQGNDSTPRRWPLPNVWLGVSAEDQRRADERVPDLLATPASVRFVSAEPLLGPIYPQMIDLDRGVALDWIIVGGESGRGARPMHPDWARSLRDQCARSGIPFFFKQWGAWTYTHPKWPNVVPTVMANDGTLYAPHDLAFPDGARWGEALRAGHDKAHLTNIYRLGKKAAGRLLDGVEHNGMPHGTAVPARSAA